MLNVVSFSSGFCPFIYTKIELCAWGQGDSSGVFWCTLPSQFLFDFVKAACTEKETIKKNFPTLLCPFSVCWVTVVYSFPTATFKIRLLQATMIQFQKSLWVFCVFLSHFQLESMFPSITCFIWKQKVFVAVKNTMAQ